ncbi:hypothetical protein BDW62DRAFT_174547 [Aspergillus aurantiobrunneus]
MTSVAAKSSLFEKASSLNPSSPGEWRPVLQEIKLLYIQRQYKRCVARSSSILSTARESIHPVHKTFLYFYCAISYEAMGRYAHDYSDKKIPLLNSALDCFVTCLAVLPVAVPVDKSILLAGSHDSNSDSESQTGGYGDSCINISETGAEILPSSEFAENTLPLSLSRSPSRSPSLSPSQSTARSRSTSPTESVVSSITDIIDKTLACAGEDPFLSDSEDVVAFGLDVDMGDTNRILAESTFEFENENEAQSRLMPSPLHVRKSSKPLPLILPSLDSNSGTNASSKTQTGVAFTTTTVTRSRPPPLPLPVRAVVPEFDTEIRNLDSQGHSPKPSLLQTSAPGKKHTFHYFPSTKTYNNSLRFLHRQMTSTITALHTLIHEVTSIQQARASSRRSIQRSTSFWSFSPVKKGSEISSVLGQKTTHGPCSSFSSRGISTSAPSSKRESIQERIIRLRADGWDNVGLRNKKRGWKGVEYYKEFCGMVLDELYLG